MARSAGDLWPLYDLLQSLRSLGKSRRLGPDQGCTGRNSWYGGSDDRYVCRTCASARSLHRGP